MCSKGTPKVVSQFIHTQKRAKERLNFNLTKEMYNNIINSIEKKSNVYYIEFITKQSNRMSMYRVIINNFEPFIVCYDCKRHALSTIFNEDKNITYISKMIDVYGNPSNISEYFGVKSIWIDVNGDIINLDEFTHDNNIYYHISSDRSYMYDGTQFIALLQ